MNPAWRLDPQALECFRALSVRLGLERGQGLEAWLAGDGAAVDARTSPQAADDVPPGPGPEGLCRLGCQELAGLTAWLERESRRALLERLTRGAGRRLPRGARRLPGWALPSLRACLLCPPPGAPGWIERAGLHRLARALADRTLSPDQGGPAGLGPGERAVLCAAHAWLAGVPAARREAGPLRRRLGLGG